MNTLYVESIELATEVRTLVQHLMQKDADLARRMRRSAEELAEHVEESMLSTGRTRRVELRAAEDSVKELAACVRAAKSVGYLEPHPLGYLEPQPLRLEARIAELTARLALGSEHKRAQAV